MDDDDDIDDGGEDEDDDDIDDDIDIDDDDIDDDIDIDDDGGDGARRPMDHTRHRTEYRARSTAGEESARARTASSARP